MTTKQFNQSVNADIRRITAVQVCNAGDWPDHLPESFEDWLKQGNDAIDDPGGNDLGGNWTPDKYNANLDRYGNDNDRPF